MCLLNNDRLANRVTIALLAAIALVVGAWFLGRRPASPADAPAPRDFFGEAAGRPAPSTRQRIADLQTRLKALPDDWVAYSQLGAVYLQQARETGDPTYYQKADEALAEALRREPGDYAALAAAGELALARHDFAGALQIGQQARDLNPQRTVAYGIIADAQVELGRYAEAAETLQAMVNLRPDLSSYSRIAYLRELHGDLDGALEAMQLAVDAGGPSREASLWTRVQLGHLRFNTGRLAEAEAEYQRALAVDPAYVHALAGLARVAAARADYATAIRLYQDVTARLPSAEYVIALGDVYAAAGQAANAQQTYDLVSAIDQLYRANGVNTDLELALFLADHGAAAEAVERAESTYAERPTVFAADVLAWALYQAGDYAEAERYSREALRLGTQDALKHYHAGLIQLKLGNTAEARQHVEQALAVNPYFSLRYAADAAQRLQSLGPE